MPEELAAICEHLNRFRAVTLQSLERTPADRLAWSPSPDLMTFAGQFAHLACIERLYVRGMRGDGWQPEVNVRHVDQSIGQLRSELLEVRKITNTWIETLLPAALDEMVHVPWLPVKWSLRSWLWYLVEHELHHKAQLALYLNLCGVEAPFFAFPLPPSVRPDKRPFTHAMSEPAP